jgi:hypothetical protein
MSEKRHLPAQILVRLPERLARIIRHDAEDSEISDASAVRRVLVAHYQNAEIEDEAPTKRAKPPHPARSIEFLEISRLRESVGELGGTLRQIAGLSRLDGQTANHAEIEEILPRIREIARALDECKTRLP